MHHFPFYLHCFHHFFTLSLSSSFFLYFSSLLSLSLFFPLSVSEDNPFHILVEHEKSKLENNAVPVTVITWGGEKMRMMSTFWWKRDGSVLEMSGWWWRKDRGRKRERGRERNEEKNREEESALTSNRIEYTLMPFWRLVAQIDGWMDRKSIKNLDTREKERKDREREKETGCN